MIDFTTVFGKQKVERLHFKTRPNVNYLHEVVFLSSYLHDAMFCVADMTFKKGTVKIPVDRDCWEFWTRLHHVRDQLLGCRSLLTISGVKSLRWSRKRLPGTVEVTTVFVGEEQFIGDGAHLVCHSIRQKLRLDLFGEDSYFGIELRDLEDPR